MTEEPETYDNAWLALAVLIAVIYLLRAVFSAADNTK